MHAGIRSATAGAAVIAACALSSCGNSSSSDQKALRTILTTTTTEPPTSSTTSSPTSTTMPGVTVPNIIGAKIATARVALHMLGLPSVPLNTPCNRGTLASQSVVSSLAIPGKAPDVRIGAVPLMPGAVVPPGTRIGISWSGCFGDAAAVPNVVGLTFVMARHDLYAAGLTWACYSVGKETTTTRPAPPTTTTTTTTKGTSTTTDSTATTAATTATTVVAARQTVLTQRPGPGTVLHPGSPVSLTMQACPQ